MNGFGSVLERESRANLKCSTQLTLICCCCCCCCCCGGGAWSACACSPSSFASHEVDDHSIRAKPCPTHLEALPLLLLFMQCVCFKPLVPYPVDSTTCKRSGASLYPTTVQPTLRRCRCYCCACSACAGSPSVFRIAATLLTAVTALTNTTVRPGCLQRSRQRDSEVRDGLQVAFQVVSPLVTVLTNGMVRPGCLHRIKKRAGG